MYASNARPDTQLCRDPRRSLFLAQLAWLSYYAAFGRLRTTLSPQRSTVAETPRHCAGQHARVPSHRSISLSPTTLLNPEPVFEWRGTCFTNFLAACPARIAIFVKSAHIFLTSWAIELTVHLYKLHVPMSRPWEY